MSFECYVIIFYLRRGNHAQWIYPLHASSAHFSVFPSPPLQWLSTHHCQQRQNTPASASNDGFELADTSHNELQVIKLVGRTVESPSSVIKDDNGSFWGSVKIATFSSELWPQISPLCPAIGMMDQVSRSYRLRTIKIIPSGAKEFRNQREIPNNNNNFLIDHKEQDSLRSMNRVSVQCKVGADIFRPHINCGFKVYEWHVEFPETLPAFNIWGSIRGSVEDANLPGCKVVSTRK